MNTMRSFSLALVAGAALAACGSPPADPVGLELARSDYRSLQVDPQAQGLESVEMQQATQALARANAAQAGGADRARVEHLAYLARQRVALAREVLNRKTAEAAVAEASAERDRLRLAARTSEADAATQRAAAAGRDAAGSRREAETSRQQALDAQQQAEASRRHALEAQQQAVGARAQAGEADRHSAALQAQLRELEATKTERGLVVTLGDVLFDTGQAQLKPGGLRHLERLGDFLKAYPERKAVIEGFTDSTGNDAGNLALSGRRADAVLQALLGLGATRDQLSAEGHGSTRPVAGNETAAGRQMNRRVEVVLPE